MPVTAIQRALSSCHRAFGKRLASTHATTAVPNSACFTKTTTKTFHYTNTTRSTGAACAKWMVTHRRPMRREHPSSQYRDVHQLAKRRGPALQHAANRAAFATVHVAIQEGKQAKAIRMLTFIGAVNASSRAAADFASSAFTRAPSAPADAHTITEALAGEFQTTTRTGAANVATFPTPPLLQRQPQYGGILDRTSPHPQPRQTQVGAATVRASQ